MTQHGWCLCRGSSLLSQEDTLAAAWFGSGGLSEAQQAVVSSAGWGI